MLNKIMRWKTPETPKNGEQRTRRVFAWKPTKIGKETVWLEFYAVREQFFVPAGGGPGWWAYRSTETLDYYC
jgi:hypothetical protein